MTQPSEKGHIIASWNVNSIRPRLAHLLAWLKEEQPDVALLQETKVVDEAFPREAIEDAGYSVAFHGQKTYNGVAILARGNIEDVHIGLDDEPEDTQARYIEALVTIGDASPIRVASVYLPNGQAVDSDKFTYKKRFFSRLNKRMQHLLAQEEITIIGGDYNVAPAPIDVYDPARLDGTICYHPDERAALRRITNQGWYDALRVIHPDEQAFSWWDYRAGAWQRNHGMRIDHLLLSPDATDRVQDAGVHREVRAQEKASDHAPAWCRIAASLTLMICAGLCMLSPLSSAMAQAVQETDTLSAQQQEEAEAIRLSEQFKEAVAPLGESEVQNLVHFLLGLEEPSVALDDTTLSDMIANSAISDASIPVGFDDPIELPDALASSLADPTLELPPLEATDVFVNAYSISSTRKMGDRNAKLKPIAPLTRTETNAAAPASTVPTSVAPATESRAPATQTHEAPPPTDTIFDIPPREALPQETALDKTVAEATAQAVQEAIAPKVSSPFQANPRPGTKPKAPTPPVLLVQSKPTPKPAIPLPADAAEPQKIQEEALPGGKRVIKLADADTTAPKTPRLQTASSADNAVDNSKPFIIVSDSNTAYDMPDTIDLSDTLAEDGSVIPLPKTPPTQQPISPTVSQEKRVDRSMLDSVASLFSSNTSGGDATQPSAKKAKNTDIALIALPPDSPLIPNSDKQEEITPIVTAQKADSAPAPRAHTTQKIDAFVPEAQFTTAIQNRSPTDALQQISYRKGEVYYYTKLKGLAGQTVTHIWELDGHPVVTKPFTIGGDIWRVWSRAMLNTAYQGKTVSVRVVNAENQVLASTKILVTP